MVGIMVGNLHGENYFLINLYFTNIFSYICGKNMKKQDIISEMEHRLSLYKTIKPKEFDFSDFVTYAAPAQITEEPCGTVCCLWGWEPKLTGVVKWEGRYGAMRSSGLIKTKL